MGQLRDYTLIIPAGGTVSAEVDGDFFLIRKCKQLFSAALDEYGSTSDIIVKCEFDDSGKISRRAGEGGKRAYKRVTFSLVTIPPNWPSLDTRIEVTLGYGELYSEREEQPVSTSLSATVINIPAMSSVVIKAVNNYSTKEIRLNIPSTESGGLWYSPDDVWTGTDEVWLEKGVIEFLDYTGKLVAHNRSASAININVGNFLRKDY